MWINLQNVRKDSNENVCSKTVNHFPSFTFLLGLDPFRYQYNIEEEWRRGSGQQVQKYDFEYAGYPY